MWKFELMIKTKEDIEIFREFFSKYFEKHKEKGCLKQGLTTLIPLFLSIYLFIITLSGLGKNRVGIFSGSFERVICLVLFLYIIMLFLLLTATTFGAGNDKILDRFLKVLFIVILFANFVQINYNPMKNDKLFVFGVISTAINLLVIFFSWVFMLTHNIFECYNYTVSVFLLILVPKFISDCITCIITEVYIKSLNDGYNNENDEINEKTGEKYSKKYLKNIRLRAQLLMLILIFFSVVLFPTENKELNSSFINVVSCISLAMMFFDKRKEWNFDDLKNY